MSWEQNQRAAQAYAEARFVTGSGFARSNCPFCLDAVGKEDRKQCFAVNVATGFWKCWRCGTKGKLDIGEPAQTPAQTPAQESVQPPEGFLSLTEEPARSALSAEDAREYLRGRGLVDESLWALTHIGCCLTGRFEGRVVVPILSPGGEWWSWISRVWVKHPAEGVRVYMNAPGVSFGTTGRLFNQAALAVPTDEPVLVVEGVFDALALWPDAVAVLGKPTRAQVDTLNEARRPVAVCLDGDAWQEAETLALRLDFMGHRAGFVRLPPGKDPDEVDRSWLKEEARTCLR